ncbi:SRPBCC family protein [Streptomyces sp. DH12]|uniref:SRPBCC family protein n=1 Tax=Streptomyces sp. DH12 TaxID=2857010 RepID=UPI001E468374|nr:SRPBCC family protein [Streptomyces sp. DH12]
MSGILDQINAAHREISDGPVGAGEGRSLVLRRSYDAPVDEVWSACTDPARIRRWLAPVSGDLRVGGVFQVAGHTRGRVLHCDRPRLLRATWEYGQGAVTEVAVRLTEDPAGGTLLELRHASRADVADELLRTRGPAGAVANGAGWDLTLLGLGQHLQGRDVEAVRREDAPQIREYALRSCRAWGAVSQAVWGIRADDLAGIVETAFRRVAPEVCN